MRNVFVLHPDWQCCYIFSQRLVSGEGQRLFDKYFISFYLKMFKGGSVNDCPTHIPLMIKHKCLAAL